MPTIETNKLVRSKDDCQVQLFLEWCERVNSTPPELNTPEFERQFTNWLSWGMCRDEVG